jgi:hypothetical protein
VSDDWFDDYAAGDFLPGSATRERDGSPVEEFAEGFVAGMERMREYHLKDWWRGYASALHDLAEPIVLPAPGPCQTSPTRRRPLYGAGLRARVRA